MYQKDDIEDAKIEYERSLASRLVLAVVTGLVLIGLLAVLSGR